MSEQRVAVFIDGKHYNAGWHELANRHPIDFPRLAAWLVLKAGGDKLVGATYYTGVGEDVGEGLDRFLGMLEHQPGYFVKRFDRVHRSKPCSRCGRDTTFTQEKQVDTSIVADVLTMANDDAYDIAVLVAGDADHTPAAKGVRALGKTVFVACWGKYGLSGELRRNSHDHIDLMEFIGKPVTA